ncbi:MAG: hypothetical protein KF893_03300 [Caldilineaceae bacterium]|nr:hypothetical protein [Caldilineaceae bacterium]
MSLSPIVATGSEQSISIEDLLRAISMPLSTRERPLRTERINVAHVADSLRRYPGERLRFFTRVQAREALDNFNLEIHLPDAVQIKDVTVLSGNVTVQPGIFRIDSGTYIAWKIDRPVEAGEEFEFCVHGVVRQREDNINVLSRAVLSARSQGHEDTLEDEETAAVFVTVQARYIRYLPALYAQDRFMNRFLMLFESFWDPLQQQIAGMENYFDPTVTPPDFLPWLSSWIALPMTEEEESSPTRQESIPAQMGSDVDGRHLLPALSDSGAAASGASSQRSGADSGVREGISDDDGFANRGSDFGIGEIGLGGSGDVIIDGDDDSTDTGIVLTQKPWQARQTYLPPMAGGAGGNLSLLRGDDARRAKSSRGPLILPSAAENARQLLKVAQQLHKRRGTRLGLQQYLQIYTDTEVHVIEHRAENFILKERAALGSRVALGHNNHPHSFTVVIRFYVRQDKLDLLGNTVIEQRKAVVRRRVIPIIEEQKPAHTTYHLSIEVVSI